MRFSQFNARHNAGRFLLAAPKRRGSFVHTVGAPVRVIHEFVEVRRRTRCSTKAMRHWPPHWKSKGVLEEDRMVTKEKNKKDSGSRPQHGKKPSPSDHKRAASLASEIEGRALELSQIFARTTRKKYATHKLLKFSFNFGNRVERGRSVSFDFAATNGDSGPTPGPMGPDETVGGCYDLEKSICCSGPCPC